MSNRNLNKAKEAKNDEFYTKYADVEEEMKYYIKHFENKTIYCNCDNPIKSNFTKYFVNNFKALKLKRFISSGYIKNGIGNILDITATSLDFVGGV